MSLTLFQTPATVYRCEKVTDRWQQQRRRGGHRRAFLWSGRDTRMSQHPLFSLFQLRACYRAADAPASPLKWEKMHRQSDGKKQRWRQTHKTESYISGWKSIIQPCYCSWAKHTAELFMLHQMDTNQQKNLWSVCKALMLAIADTNLKYISVKSQICKILFHHTHMVNACKGDLIGILTSAKKVSQGAGPTIRRDFLLVSEPVNNHRWLSSHQAWHHTVLALQKLMVGAGVAEWWTLCQKRRRLRCLFCTQ